MKVITAITVLLCVTAQMGFALPPREQSKSLTSQEIADRIVESDIPVMVDFWASWCTACIINEPVLDELAKEYEGRIRFVKVDVDRHRSIVQHFRVNSIPTIFVVEDKTVRSAFSGARDKKTYAEALDKALEMSAARKKLPQ